MTDDFECKKDALRQTQDGIWKLTLTVLPEDMPTELLQAPMGSVYGLAMVPIDYDNPVARSNRGVESDAVIPVSEKSEGEKLRRRAHCLCKDNEFIAYVWKVDGYSSPKSYIYEKCNIKSRSELTTDVAAQERFKELDHKFKNWQFVQRHKDNLDRED